MLPLCRLNRNPTAMHSMTHGTAWLMESERARHTTSLACGCPPHTCKPGKSTLDMSADCFPPSPTCFNISSQHGRGHPGLSPLNHYEGVNAPGAQRVTLCSRQTQQQQQIYLQHLLDAWTMMDAWRYTCSTSWTLGLLSTTTQQMRHNY